MGDRRGEGDLAMSDSAERTRRTDAGPMDAGPMDIEAAWARLAAGSKAPQDQEAVVRHVHRQAKEVFFNPQQAEEQAQELLIKVFERLAFGTIHVQGSFAAYVRTALKNRLVSALRARRPEVPFDEKKPEATHPSPSRPLDERADLVALLQRAYLREWERRAPRYQPSLEEAWLELSLRVEEELNGPEVLTRTKGLTPGTPAMTQALCAFHRRDSRLLDALMKMLLEMKEEGLLDDVESDFVRRMQQILLKSQVPKS